MKSSRMREKYLCHKPVRAQETPSQTKMFQVGRVPLRAFSYPQESYILLKEASFQGLKFGRLFEVLVEHLTRMKGGMAGSQLPLKHKKSNVFHIFS